jgi:membrane-associated phospholipid phosphatase
MVRKGAVLDIDILLMLQAFREGAGGCLTEFISKMTWFGEMNVVLVIIGLIYWCVSKRVGTYLLMGWSGNRIVNGVLKVAACAYRPWIRDPRIVPEPAAMKTATGYSFPSGHSMNAASLFGGLAIRRDIGGCLRALMWTFLCLIAFSRIFLGVHTPQDILVGSAVGVLVMFLTGRLLQWLESNPGKDVLVAIVGVAIAVVAAVYSATKSYPVDYDASGKLLVDGMKMANDTFKAVGWLSAFMLGWILERRYVGFTTDVPVQERFCRLAGGLLGYYIVFLVAVPPITAALVGFSGTVVTSFLQMFYVVFVFPLLMTRLGVMSEGEDR